LKLIIYFIFTLAVHAKDFNYKKPNKFDFLYNTTDNFKTLYDKSIDKENLWIWEELQLQHCSYSNTTESWLMNQKDWVKS